jgi:hypothetical protein
MAYDPRNPRKRTKAPDRRQDDPSALWWALALLLALGSGVAGYWMGGR